jgi:hypothetical protein
MVDLLLVRHERGCDRSTVSTSRKRS